MISYLLFITAPLWAPAGGVLAAYAFGWRPPVDPEE